MEGHYNRHVESFREKEYPMLKDAIYLDHAGTTLCSKSLMERFTADMMSNLYGNPHSASPSSQLSTSRIEDTRLKVLQYFRADPEHFHVVFVANATAGIKLVMEALRALDGGFSYTYHMDSHTSLVGVREGAIASYCLDDGEVENWLSGNANNESAPVATRLFAYPAQSNLDGRRLPLSWAQRVKSLCSPTKSTIYTLLDASALVSTAQLDLNDIDKAPDFTVLSFYKIFGFPDLGALVVRKDSGAILQKRKYFGGGTVDVVLSVKEQWHALKGQSLHESLEDGTLPFHSIMALSSAIDVHADLYGSMDRIAKHTSFLAQKLYTGLKALKHANSLPVCVVYSKGDAFEENMQGPVVAFNIQNSQGAWVSNVEFERLASIRNFHIRSGGLCNPGGVANFLDLEPWEMRRNFSAGFRCGVESDIYAGKITGIIRASVGAMSTVGDVEAFVSFVKEFYVENKPAHYKLKLKTETKASNHLFVESLTIYPIKSCGGYSIPASANWEIRPEGLAWDREWCLVHQGTGQALSQKRYPKMSLIRPTLDFDQGLLHIECQNGPTSEPQKTSIPLSAHPTFCSPGTGNKLLSSRVCGDNIIAQTYNSAISDFFTRVLEVPCTLARFPAGGSGFGSRHSKAHMQKHQRLKNDHPNMGSIPGAYQSTITPLDSDCEVTPRPILLSNESPILSINKSSLNALNKAIIETGGSPAAAAVFRANIVIASKSPETEKPYDEDHWTRVRIGQQDFQMLGSCRRCHMICINQDTAEKDEEPFVTLAKTRRFDSKVFFGSHMCHVPDMLGTKDSQFPTIRVGDVVSVDVAKEI
ncbi:hypothetical protein HYALB_00003793 [Hymenoscyphus albidus]|uniref:Molybdenum cofactor sulfurase n=1 Tax=Hymenoscyphus albidus TaxID=595503 RepID=A0A9N9LYS8_9HELO|nr:hypothetical protein HYALB_00003793 [Hymenoscyphus albidus]